MGINVEMRLGSSTFDTLTGCVSFTVAVYVSSHLRRNLLAKMYRRDPRQGLQLK